MVWTLPKRGSVRSFLSKEVDMKSCCKYWKLQELLLLPVTQPWKIIVVENTQTKMKLYESYPRDWFAEAPIILVVCADRKQSWKRRDGKDYGDVDVAIAVDHMTLAAADLGLGTCWIGAFDDAKCRRVLQLPQHLEPIAMLPLGYPAKVESPERHVTRRKSLDEIVQWD